MNDSEFPSIYPYLKLRTQKIIDVTGVLMLPISIIVFLYLIELRGYVNSYILFVLGVVCALFFLNGIGCIFYCLDKYFIEKP